MPHPSAQSPPGPHAVATIPAGHGLRTGVGAAQ